MATFDEFYASLDPDVGIRGKQFEKFIKWFLKTDPTWVSQIDEIWLWNEYPKKWGADCGIDLIFNHKNGKTWAVQSKCISPNNDIKKSEIDSFLSESSDPKIDGRLLIASTDGIGKNAQQVINRQDKQVVCFLLEQFRQSEIEFPSSMEDLNQGKRKDKKTPRPHQIEAIEKVLEGLKTAGRGQVLMACGTGKTLTSLWIKESLKAEQVLVLVPSLSLLSQTLKEWNAEAHDDFKWICVCSDKSVAKNKYDDQWISNTSEIGVPVTSETLEIKNFLDESGNKVVFSTYQSAQLIVEAQEHHDTSDFDLVIADEAHRCAGKVSSAFGSVLDENKIKASKRLFFTATPRILSKKIQTKSLDMDFEVASMDDYSVFGEILFELKFSKAIKKDLLSDYQVVVIAVDDEIIKQKIINRELINIDDDTILDAEMIASQIAITKAIKEYDLKRIITFHSRIKNAKEFATSFDNVIQHINQSDSLSKKVYCQHISGGMKTSERNQKLYELKNLKVDETRILTNARCLSEGVDVPTLSGIAFINPKHSQIDIIQAVGRAIRKSHDKSKGTIVIPLYISEKESLDEAILLSNFKKVWGIVTALKSQDDSLMECIDRLRIQKGSVGKISFAGNELEKIIFDIPEKISSKFSKSIQTILIENASEDWFEKYGQLRTYFEKNGHSSLSVREPLLGTWCSFQREQYRKKNLSKEKIELLDQIEFDWDPKETQWRDTYKLLKEFYKKEGHSSPEVRHETLGGWCHWQRILCRRKKISTERIQLLDQIEFDWDPLDTKWKQSYRELKEFYVREGHSSPAREEKSYEVLGVWCHSQRRAYQQKKLSVERIELLEQIEFVWNLVDKQWHDTYKVLKEFYEREGHSAPTGRGLPIVSWCNGQRQQYKLKELSAERIELLDNIEFKWDPVFYLWEKKYDELKKFYDREGHSSPKKKTFLHSWCHSQRTGWKNNKLSQEQINLLNLVEFNWDPLEKLWNESYNKLKKFYEREGHSSPPRSQKITSEQWCEQQRKQYRNKSLSKNRIELLEQIEFVWEPNINLWNKQYQKLKQLYEREGNISLPLPSDLQKWCWKQRNNFKENKLSQKRVKLLNSIEFRWKEN